MNQKEIKTAQKSSLDIIKVKEPWLGKIVCWRVVCVQRSTSSQHEKGQVTSSNEHKAKTRPKETQAEHFQLGQMDKVANLTLYSILYTEPRWAAEQFEVITEKGSLDTKMKPISTLTYCLWKITMETQAGQATTTNQRQICCNLFTVFLCET